MAVGHYSVIYFVIYLFTYFIQAPILAVQRQKNMRPKKKKKDTSRKPVKHYVQSNTSSFIA